MPEQLEPEIVSVAVGELYAPQDWRDAYVAGYSVGELDSNPSGISSEQEFRFSRLWASNLTMQMDSGQSYQAA